VKEVGATAVAMEAAEMVGEATVAARAGAADRKSTRLNSSHT
jgi:hypothetical protein